MSHPQESYGVTMIIESPEARELRLTIEQAEGEAWLESERLIREGIKPMPVPHRRYVGVEKMKAYLIEEAKRARVDWANSRALRALPVQRKWRAKEEYIIILGLISTFKAACK